MSAHFIIRNLPLTANQEQMKKWIKEAIGRFVKEIDNIVPLKYSKRSLNGLPEDSMKFFEGKFDGNWRVSVSPKGNAEVPTFVAFGPQMLLLQGVIKYSKRGQPVNELCWSCYNEGHKKFEKDEDGKFICEGPMDWFQYIELFRKHACEVSEKTEEELFSFESNSPQVTKLEKELAIIAEKLENSVKETENKEKITGCTIHHVNSKLDSGKIILQKKIRVFKNDTAITLKKRVLKQEHIAYPLAIKKIISNP